MEFKAVVSSNILGIGYDPELQELRVQFSSGGTYSYAGVPQDEYDGLMEAGSKGSYLNANLKGVYPHSRV